jgi:hypothetical protein
VNSKTAPRSRLAERLEEQWAATLEAAVGAKTRVRESVHADPAPTDPT